MNMAKKPVQRTTGKTEANDVEPRIVAPEFLSYWAPHATPTDAQPYQYMRMLKERDRQAKKLPPRRVYPRAIDGRGSDF